MLLIKDKIGAVMPGVPTISDKYDVMSGIVDTKAVFEGQLVDLETLLKDGKVKAASTTTKRAGVVMHQNVKLETPEESKGLQTFKPGEVVGVCIKGFVTALAHKDHDGTALKLQDEEIKHDGSTELTALTNIFQTGKLESNKQLDKKIVEVEVK